jgi:hypothetical protein
MSHDEIKIKMVTVEEANALLPQVRLYLKSLRDLRSIILRTQAQIEIEEMTGSSSKGELSPSGQTAVTRYMEILHHQSTQFEEKLAEMVQLGAYLKDLETGLVDFYSRRGGEVVFLCWKEGEEEVKHWHNLQGGYQNRKPLDPPVF